MDDLISRAAAMEACRESKWAQMRLEYLPAADHKKGAWVGIDQEPHEIYECNSCGWLLYEVDTKDFRFCPSCGARMEEEYGNKV